MEESEEGEDDQDGMMTNFTVDDIKQGKLSVTVSPFILECKQLKNIKCGALAPVWST